MYSPTSNQVLKHNSATEILLFSAMSAQRAQSQAHGQSATRHPFCPLSASEITTAASLIRQLWPTGTDLHYKAITLFEPTKVDGVRYLDAEHASAAGRNNHLPDVTRKAFVNYYLRNTNRFHEAIVNLSTGKVDRNVRLGANVHGCGDSEEIIMVERVALEDEGVKELIGKLRLPEGTVVICDPWIYGTYMFFPVKIFLFQTLISFPPINCLCSYKEQRIAFRDHITSLNTLTRRKNHHRKNM